MKANAANADDYEVIELRGTDAEITAKLMEVQSGIQNGTYRRIKFEMWNDFTSSDDCVGVVGIGVDNLSVIWDLHGRTLTTYALMFYFVENVEITDSLTGGVIQANHEDEDKLQNAGKNFNGFVALNYCDNLTISGGSITGSTGIATVALNSSISITGGKIIPEDNTRPAIYLTSQSQYVYDEVEVTISGGEISGDLRLGEISDEEEEEKKGNLTLNITGGKINGDIIAWDDMAEEVVESAKSTSNATMTGGVVNGNFVGFDEDYNLTLGDNISKKIDDDGNVSYGNHNVTDEPNTGDDDNDDNDNTGDNDNDDSTPSTPSTDGNKTPSTDEPTENKMFIMLLIGGGTALALVLVGIAIAMLCKRRKK